jgi:hypothetical protein
LKPDRPKQQIPAEIVADLMSAIRNQFYPDAALGGPAAKHWGQDSHFIKIRVVLWPATWLNKKGVTLKPERYKQIILEVLNEIKTHGQTEVVKYWPGYLAKCIQERFKHQAEQIYQEGKNLRTQLENTIGKLPTPTIDPIIVMAEARNALLKAGAARTSKKPPGQLDLFK